jgi:hypothetical protein
MRQRNRVYLPESIERRKQTLMVVGLVELN